VLAPLSVASVWANGQPSVTEQYVVTVAVYEQQYHQGTTLPAAGLPAGPALRRGHRAAAQGPAELRNQGILPEEEFAAQKSRILCN
jgi:hypothetical protein